MLRAVIITFAVLARAEGGYNYQHPTLAFQYPGQQTTQGTHSISQPSYIGSSPHVATQQSQQGYYHQFNQHSSYNSHYQSASNFNNALSQNVQQSQPNSVHSNAVISAPAQPIVTKHIYFHVAPPDVVASVTPAPIKRKKTYNIVFIKVPSQQQQKFYINSQGFLTNPYSPVEAKTLVYVLVKNPDGQANGSEKAAPNHEVYYVKYKGNANSAASQISASVAQPQVSQSGVTSVRSLSAGLINGQN